MKDVSRGWAKSATDVILAVVLVGGEAVAWLTAVLLSMLLAVDTEPWVPPACLGAFAVCSGLIAAGAWSLRLWVTAAVQALVTGCCLVMLLISLYDGVV
ncbi:hypothetical protein ABT142_18115 [Streptomyces sp. NPDC001857]|uniref:hypothetical protein n=1 Tax=unclassified Streptomyces TaxID=2593676 RepID=UPI00331C17D5